MSDKAKPAEVVAIDGSALTLHTRAKAGQVNGRLVERLEDLLEEAKAGELQAFAYTALYGEIHEGEHAEHASSWVFPDKVSISDRYRMAGMMQGLTVSLATQNNEYEEAQDG